MKNIPAFPVPAGDMQSTGLSLRDYFAAKAMQGIIIGNEAALSSLGIGAAKDAYAMADAMLEARDS